MDFIVDESTGATVVEYLRTLGHDVLAVAEVMAQANDQDIMAILPSNLRSVSIFFITQTEMASVKVSRKVL